MDARATGEFTVELSRKEPDGEEAATSRLGRMAIAKRFSGDLDATSVGEMLSVMTEVEGSAGYVALERVTGTLGGRVGSFVLQHDGTMDRGVPQLRVGVVPDSGTEGLAGLQGTMTIVVEDGTHRYGFDFSLPEVEP